MNNATKAAAAAVTVFLSYSSAHAVDVEYYKASVEFSRQIGTCYENAPAVLKRAALNPRVIVVGDTRILGKVQRMTNAPKSDIVKFSRSSVSGDKFVAVAYRGVLGAQPRSIMFNEETLGDDMSSFVCHAVVHEMMHLFDQGPSRKNISDASALSRSPEFMAAFNAGLVYFFSDPFEAFAEAGANLIAPLTETEFTGRNADHKHAMKRINAYMQNFLTSIGMLEQKTKPVAGVEVPYLSKSALRDVTSNAIDNATSFTKKPMAPIKNWCPTCSEGSQDLN